MEISHSDIIKHYDRELPRLMAVPAFYEYALQVYNYLELLKPGRILALQASEERLPWLLVTVGAFLDSSDHWMDYELNDDYTKLRRTFLPDNFRKVMRRA